MQYKITHPQTPLHGAISLDGSKSISNRALIIQALCPQACTIRRLSTSDDTIALQNALRQSTQIVDVGAAGTTMRFLTAFFAAQEGADRILTGTQRMKQRPIGVLVDALRALGADITYLEQEGFPPLHIKGQKLLGGTIRISANVSSQYISALLLIAPLLEKGISIELEGTIVSRTYLQMTLQLMQYFGANYSWIENTICVEPMPYQAKDFTVEADWSAASYYYAMVAFSKQADVQLMGLYTQELQGDSQLVQMMAHFGVQTKFIAGGIQLQKKAYQPTPFVYDFVTCPDIAQTLAVVCTGLATTAQFSGLITLSIKETDRTAALQTELAPFGGHFVGKGNQWQLSLPNGFQNTPSHIIPTYHDHRMAMAFAPLAMQCPDGIMIDDPMVVTKSYPKFWEDIQQFGFVVCRL